MSDQIRELLAEAARRARAETNDEPEPGMTGETQYPIQCAVGKGLEGAIATDTKIGYVNGAKGWLVYRGLNIFDLAEYSTYEETSYLLLYGQLPPIVMEVLEKIPTARTHPMAALRTAVSVLGNLDESSEKLTVEAERDVAIKLIAQMPTLAGAIARIRRGEAPLSPREDLSHAANYLYLMSGEEPDELSTHVLDISLILHADHGMNASTFTTMVVNSSLSDMYGSVTAGIASLKGPLHGGANEQVLYDLEEIGSPDKAEVWFAKARESKRKVMGFGHRVYKAYDPRARILGPLAQLLAKRDPEIENLYKIATRLDGLVCSQLGAEKKIFPNVDFYSGIVYRALGIETAMFTPIFAVSRVFRPRALYTGPPRVEYVPLEKR